MYIINTTFVVEPSAHGRWYEFFLQKFVPLCRAEGFSELTFTRVLHEDTQGHYTYSLQVAVDSIPEYQRFVAEIMTDYGSTVLSVFGEQVLHFTTLLKRIML
ncbi:MAG: DUF4286 family protein [Mucinivorans sp.]